MNISLLFGKATFVFLKNIKKLAFNTNMKNIDYKIHNKNTSHTNKKNNTTASQICDDFFISTIPLYMYRNF